MRPSSLAGSKRAAPTLLPPFEPLSSSPNLPRPVKRQNIGSGSGTGRSRAHLKYPTPVPTSSTGILSSSPPQTRPAPERTPLSAVPAVELSENGETLVMGRSSNSSHFQLSANRLISRVHVKARFIAAASPLEPSKIEIICNGWNGLKLHSQSRTWELFKGDSFTSETEGSEIMVDVQDARVLIQWPKRAVDLADSPWDDSPPRLQSRDNVIIQSSPPRRTTRIASPESPTVNLSSSRRLQALLPENGIEIYEDDVEPELPEPKAEPMDVNVSMRTDATTSFNSSRSEHSDAEDEDPDEENDPIVHSFGPFGADISSRLASITTKSPKIFKGAKRATNPLASAIAADLFAPRQLPSIPQSPKKHIVESPLSSPPRVSTPTPEPTAKMSYASNPIVGNHVINQLAFSRLSSTPLSTIMAHLPAEEKRDLAKDDLRDVIESTPCIGIIKRQGKDAAGKPLESEYYYVPEQDDDEQRRAAVVDGLRKPSLRACRKQHKQYYWKRPKTP
ncbi:transcription factor PLM2 [Fusarium albosuccineum]|uniref:Transcription factor PLM2 n=1 Tax=Fusarium albosuccineum TaxID=1237068 RepID=A0A8H4LG79_9HYPO|nr:transcription factor PLM2 [Fusarium albosuccineum]